MQEMRGKAVTLFEGNLKRREHDNREYLMKLKTEYLLRNFLLEAGRISGRGMDLQAMGGWEDPSCQLRGHFLGHWLSAAALHYEAYKDVELKAKAEVIVRESLRFVRRTTEVSGRAPFRKSICTGLAKVRLCGHHNTPSISCLWD